MEARRSRLEVIGNQRANASHSRTSLCHLSAPLGHSVPTESPHDISHNSIYRLITLVTTMAVPQDHANIQECQGVYRRPHSKTSTTLHPSPIQVPRGGPTTSPSLAVQVAINEANAIFTHRPRIHRQTAPSNTTTTETRR